MGSKRIGSSSLQPSFAPPHSLWVETGTPRWTTENEQNRLPGTWEVNLPGSNRVWWGSTFWLTAIHCGGHLFKINYIEILLWLIGVDWLLSSVASLAESRHTCHLTKQPPHWSLITKNTPKQQHFATHVIIRRDLSCVLLLDEGIIMNPWFQQNSPHRAAKCVFQCTARPTVSKIWGDAKTKAWCQRNASQ